MVMEINRQSGIPIYIQLKEQIKKLIQSGQWEAGQKIPTERELASTLSLSRNTVSTAYGELEAEGILSSTQGRGTFVTDSDAVLRQEGRKERLLRIMDVALEEATELGFTIDEFLALTQMRAREKKEFLSRVKVAFVECNREQLDYFSGEMKLGSGIKIIPILLDDYRKDTAAVNEVLKDVDIIASTFFHLQEVKYLAGDVKKEVLGIALNPRLETIVKIARFPSNSKLGIVCSSENFVAKIKNELRQAGITHLQFKTTITRTPDELKHFLENLNAIIVSPNRKQEISGMIGGVKQVIEFEFLPDAGSVNLIKSLLLEHKNR